MTIKKFITYVFTVWLFIKLLQGKSLFFLFYYNGNFLATGVFASPCGHIHKDSVGYISSPNFPYDKYPPMADCKYTIEAPPGKAIKVRF